MIVNIVRSYLLGAFLCQASIETVTQITTIGPRYQHETTRERYGNLLFLLLLYRTFLLRDNFFPRRSDGNDKLSLRLTDQPSHKSYIVKNY